MDVTLIAAADDKQTVEDAKRILNQIPDVSIVIGRTAKGMVSQPFIIVQKERFVGLSGMTHFVAQEIERRRVLLLEIEKRQKEIAAKQEKERSRSFNSRLAYS